MTKDVVNVTKVATLYMAAQDGTLSKNQGQTLDQLLENYAPEENDDEEDSSDEEEDLFDIPT